MSRGDFKTLFFSSVISVCFWTGPLPVWAGKHDQPSRKHCERLVASIKKCAAGVLPEEKVTEVNAAEIPLPPPATETVTASPQGKPENVSIPENLSKLTYELADILEWSQKELTLPYTPFTLADTLPDPRQLSQPDAYQRIEMIQDDVYQQLTRFFESDEARVMLEAMRVLSPTEHAQLMQKISERTAKLFPFLRPRDVSKMVNRIRIWLKRVNPDLSYQTFLASAKKELLTFMNLRKDAPVLITLDSGVSAKGVLIEPVLEHPQFCFVEYVDPSTNSVEYVELHRTRIKIDEERLFSFEKTYPKGVTEKELGSQEIENLQEAIEGLDDAKEVGAESLLKEPRWKRKSQEARKRDGIFIAAIKGFDFPPTARINFLLTKLRYKIKKGSPKGDAEFIQELRQFLIHEGVRQSLQVTPKKD